MRPWKHTNSGTPVDILRPDPDTIKIEDIAHGLSNLCRFDGQSREFYSVAQHCVFVSDYLYANHRDPRLALAGLLHDAHEAYIGDITTPVLRAMALIDRRASRAFCYIKENFDAVIGDKFNVTLRDPRIGEADLAALYQEKEELLTPCDRSWDLPEAPWPPSSQSLIAHRPASAKIYFLAVFEDLLEEIDSCG